MESLPHENLILGSFLHETNNAKKLFYHKNANNHFASYK